ncbi:tRNA 2'-phosphotransferase 1 [Agrilus planipennis]|uniref:2'-phosphotransferase n=1 Tax=Agrilus planipennis TaxID=224129 RepID=A0A1W4XQS7_AGRPL|nr:tRNA 2'-phosphotransferase 1 [Agrilus planipennis]
MVCYTQLWLSILQFQLSLSSTICSFFEKKKQFKLFSPLNTNRNTIISKTLSWLLRHAALRENLNVSPDGFVDINEVLQHKRLKKISCTPEDVREVVATNSKQRFTLRDRQGTLEICANQGHSFPVDNLELIPVMPYEFDYVIHGTYLKNWDSIRVYGLKRMKRNHIHFSSGLPSDKNIKSGIRFDAEIYIYIDINKALLSGLNFFRSVNGVVLSSGNEDGIIETKYFLKVVNASNGSHLTFP